MVREIIMRKAAPAKQLNGVREVPDLHWARMGTTAHPVIQRGGLRPTGKRICAGMTHKKNNFTRTVSISTITVTAIKWIYVTVEFD